MSMFAYYGAKRALAPLYPKPLHREIVEPFAGSAAYALLHWKNHDVHINDLSPRIYELWCYLKTATTTEIMMLPRLQKGQKIDTIPGLSSPQRTLIGAHAAVSSAGMGKPRGTVSPYGAKGVKTFRHRVAHDLHKIRNWRVTNLDYKKLENRPATWFIDPPYECPAGRKYEYNEINFRDLAEWCLSRQGQVIVCEQLGATWLPFKPFKAIRGVMKPSVEVMYYRASHV